PSLEAPSENYYDDVAHWMYTHSWLDKSEVTDPANSYENVMTHQIAFGAKNPLMQDAAEEGGGQYVTAYNKGQIVQAFNALAMMMSEAISFTAPVVSVDAANKVQSGDDLYMGLFLPQASAHWAGNLKKYKFGDGSDDRPDNWMIYDGANNEAITSEGVFLDNSSAMWADDNDANDSDNFGSHDIKEDGAGEILTERVAYDFGEGTYYERPIYTYKNGALVKFDRTTMDPEDFGLVSTNTESRDKIVNFVYGYTAEADASTGNPLATRGWALGAIIHSRPLVMDYYNTSDFSVIDQRYIAIGANDGLLHIFDDTDGSEVFAFLPPDCWAAVKTMALVENSFLVDAVDGGLMMYRDNKAPKYLITGLRRGGASYWALNITDKDVFNEYGELQWSVEWQYTNSEISQSWADPQLISIQTDDYTFTDALVLTGGYDAEEDLFPEPFDDLNYNGTPYPSGTTGTILTGEWDKNSDMDYDGDNAYDLFNPDMNEKGRGIFVFDINDPTNNIKKDGIDILPFSAIYDATDAFTDAVSDDSRHLLTLSSMKYCFPATPSVVTGLARYFDADSIIQLTDNVLKAIYAPDIYANMYKVTYDYNSGSPAWQAKKIFTGNPGTTGYSGVVGALDSTGGDDASDQGRKTFYGPAVAYGGSGNYFDASNYYLADYTFSGTDKIASLFIGTGDREHPGYTMIRNRVYAIYDDTDVAAKDAEDTAFPVTSVATPTANPYTEDDLLNLTCDELGDYAQFDNSYLKTLLRDDPSYDDSGTLTLEGISGTVVENDAKGWFVNLTEQGDSTYCSNMLGYYPTTIADYTTDSADNHDGEKILSKIILFYGGLYFTSYQPSVENPCYPSGNGFNYALDYEDASAFLNFNTDTNSDITDRYAKHLTIFGIPSGFEIIIRNGEAAAIASMGGSLLGGGDDPVNPFLIPTSGLGLDLFYWFDGNTQR
ncbi:MAG: hypothetical protein PF495_03965, partial [Spirochaetales bacterium]|nr:hypothetical protein [Spirochaetales bacterium]